MSFKPFSGYVENIRLTQEEVDTIKECFKAVFPSTDHLWIFGSRVNMKAKGGDIDLYVETVATDVSEIIRLEREFWIKLQEKFDERKIDIVMNSGRDYHLPIYDVARRDGVMLV